MFAIDLLFESNKDKSCIVRMETQTTSVLDKAGEAKVLNNNKDAIIQKYKLKMNRQVIWSFFETLS